MLKSAHRCALFKPSPYCMELSFPAVGSLASIGYGAMHPLVAGLCLPAVRSYSSICSGTIAPFCGEMFRLPTVQLFALLFQLPPRLTRLVPDAPPYKSHTVFYSKIFEPLKRLLSAGLSYFQKYTATTPHILPVRFHRFTAMDGGGSSITMFCREAKLETQNRTRMSDFEYLSGKMCEL